MTDSISSLKELAARTALQLHDIDEMRPHLPAELVTYLQTVAADISFNAIADLLAEFEELEQVHAAMSICDIVHHTSPEDGGYEQLLMAIENMLGRLEPANHQLGRAIEAAFAVSSQEWREYLIPHLLDAAEKMNAVGAKLYTTADLLRTALEK